MLLLRNITQDFAKTTLLKNIAFIKRLRVGIWHYLTERNREKMPNITEKLIIFDHFITSNSGSGYIRHVVGGCELATRYCLQQYLQV